MQEFVPVCSNPACESSKPDVWLAPELLLTLLASKETLSTSPLSLVLKATDTTAAGSTENYLNSSLKFTKDEYGQEICLLKIDEEEEVGVMMGWERGISKSPIHIVIEASLK